MRLSEFLLDNREQVLHERKDFARKIAPEHVTRVAEPRDTAERMLRFVAADIETAQRADEQVRKSIGRAPQLPAAEQRAAHEHAVARAAVSEYRALRASVTTLWLQAVPPTVDSVPQIVRFNEAIDQLIAESVVRFAGKPEADANLFNASMSHDLRIPLSVPAMRSRVPAYSPHLDEKDRVAVAQIQEAGSRLSGLVRDLQVFTRTRLGGPLVHERTAPTSARSAGRWPASCRRPIRIGRSTWRWPGTGLRRSTSVASGRYSNLIANAVQHATQGARVSVVEAGDTEQVRVTVHNAGKTIRDEDLDVILEPLKRGATARSDDNAHLGLGLYICKRIAEGHGGSITATSSDAKDTSFVLVLPRTAPGAS